ncbi:PREDICTED: uncharacterized protein LOC108801677 [Nanorana parkeri]|uniref:uncharacterized protein LOC108801677 n=1 Tax=Nanorana parkeri TaxID=125878 RepID=UPI00085444E2|nr:PREDICTED: uncharacterized protein LOC108801677 [Nanorana parkeri]
MENSVLMIINLFNLFCCFCSAYDEKANGQNNKRNLFAEQECCRRQSNFVYIGPDISGSPVSVDVGLCKSHCGVTQRVNTYNSVFSGLPKHSSMLDFLKNRKLQERVQDTPSPSGSEPSCSKGDMPTSCQATKVAIERVLLLQGIQEIAVIEDCQCIIIPQECIRMPFLKTFFPDTPFESTVDVGKCSSPDVTTGFWCVPTKFDTVIIENPNGADIVQTVETCDMKEKCYRVSYLEYYYEIVQNHKAVVEELLKEIDVGRCLGGCSTGNHCLLRDYRNMHHCLVWADGAGNGCMPQDYEIHNFRSRNGHIRTVLAIKTCKSFPSLALTVTVALQQSLPLYSNNKGRLRSPPGQPVQEESSEPGGTGSGGSPSGQRHLDPIRVLHL